ncbi:MAG: IPT/TIG domain-containing protein [Saprospiraceae bacterium]
MDSLCNQSFIPGSMMYLSLPVFPMPWSFAKRNGLQNPVFPVQEGKGRWRLFTAALLLTLPVLSTAQNRDTFFLFTRSALDPPPLPLSETVNLALDSSELGRLREANPQNMYMSLPTSQGTKVFSMYKVELLHPDFQLLNPANQPIPFERGLTYQGRVAGEEGSFITCTFLNSRAMGNLSLENRSYVLGAPPTGPARTHQLVRETINENEQGELKCGDNTLLPNGLAPPSSRADTGVSPASLDLSSKMINVHFECDYALYTYLGSSENAVLNYVVSLFNVVHALYRNDGILVRIRSLRVWTTTDPYASASSTSSSLDSLGSTFQGGLPAGSNMVHLLSRRNLGGGIAWRSSGPGLLCSTPYYSTGNAAWVGPFAVSANLSTNFSSFPAYSWSVNVVAHEMGHNIGSPHTHDCDWVGGALDNCYATEGGCAPGPAPTNGGTIMSYCHLTSAGINFNNGFGTQPGNLIRSNVAAESCLTVTAEAQINVSASTISVGSTSGSTSLSVTTSPGTLYWNVSDNADWLSLSSVTGQGNTSLTLTYSANSGGTDRSALITLVSENVSRTVTVTQSAFSAPTLPTLTTTTVSNITHTTATSGGNITSDGGAAVTARGVVWGTTTSPTIALSTKTSDGTGTGAFTSSITGLSPGTTYYVRAYATNSVGTAYGSQVSFTTLKTPVVSSFSPTSGVTGTAVLIKGSYFTGATAVSFGGTAAASFTVVDSTTITATVGSGASGAVSVTTSFGTGTKSGFTYTASSIPTIASFSPSSASPDQVVVINGTNFTGASSVTFGNVVAKLFWVNSPSKITAVVGTGASGSVAVITPGGTATRAGFSFISVSPPDVASFSPTSARRNQTVTIQGTAFNGITAVTFGGVAAQSFTRVSATAIVAVVGNGASGHVAVFGSGGVDSVAGFTFVSATPPSVRSFSPTSASSGASVQIRGSGFTGATAVSFGGTAATSFSVTSDSTISAVVGSGASGNVTVTTPGGSSSRGGFSYLVMVAPTLGSFSPTSARDGQAVTLTGTNLTGASSVSFGGTAAKSFSVISATTIVAVVGSGASGDVRVVTPAGTATRSGFTFVSAAAPTISSFSPGSASSGAAVVITGTNFSGATAVRFGGVAAASFTVNSATSISATVASGASGSVSVTTPGGTATRSGFVYTAAAPPNIGSFAPISAFTGKVVTISGTGFLGSTSVKFGGVNAKSFSVLNDNSIVATVGAGASGSVSVTNPAGTGSRTGFTFSQPLAPVITAFAPSSASTNQVVVISGGNFSGWANVRFGGALAKSASVLNDSTIAATVGSGSSGDVIVTTAGGADTLAGFVYIPPGQPTLASFSPATAGNGQTVLIRGTNFKGWATVSFGGTAAKSVSVVDSTLIVAVVGAGSSGSVRVTTGGGFAERAGFTFSGSPLTHVTISNDGIPLATSDGLDREGLEPTGGLRTDLPRNAAEPVQMLVYPNPGDGRFNLQLGLQSPESAHWLRVLDALGREVRRMDRLQSGNYTVELSGQPAGLYYFVLFDGQSRPVVSQQVMIR